MFLCLDLAWRTQTKRIVLQDPMPAETTSRPRTVPARISRDDRVSPRPDPRARLISAAEGVIAERGAAGVTVNAVCAAARVSPRAFSAAFTDRTDLLLAVFDEAIDRVGAAITAACHHGTDSWTDGVRAAVSALLAFFEENPELARFLLVDSLAGEPPMLARRSRLLEQLAQVLETGRPAAAADSSSAPFGSDAVVRSVAAILHGRLQEDPVPQLQDLSGRLTAVIVLPYLGVNAARGELSDTK